MRTTVILGGVAAIHAGITWPATATLAFLALTVGLSFAAERVAVRAGLLVHRTGPRLAGVPVAALAGWTAAVYVWYRVALLAVGVDPAAPVLAAALATASDAVADPHGVASGLWDYPDPGLPGPRFRGVPWWNFAGWFLLTLVVTAAVQPFV